MDTLSTVVLILVAFMAWGQGITWLFIGAAIMLIISIRSIPLSIIIVGGLGMLYYLDLKEYWFYFLALVVGIILIVSERKPKAAEGDYYSPELMKLLGG